MIKDRIDEHVLMEGNYVNISTVSSDKADVFVGRYNHTISGEFGGIKVSFDKLKSLLGFEEQYRRENGELVSSAVMSLEIDQSTYFIVYIDLIGGEYRMKIILDGNIISTSRVEFIHQVQTVVSTITGRAI